MKNQQITGFSQIGILIYSEANELRFNIENKRNFLYYHTAETNVSLKSIHRIERRERENIKTNKNKQEPA